MNSDPKTAGHAQWLAISLQTLLILAFVLGTYTVRQANSQNSRPAKSGNVKQAATLPTPAMPAALDVEISTPAQETATSAVAAGKSLPRKLNKPWILVYKHKNQLSLYDGDALIRTYQVITGKNAGPKQVRGDCRTPEGEFYVCTRNDKSNYYRALGLSYPTPADAKRGLKKGWISKSSHEQIITAHKHKQQPTWNTKLGGSIMIHGVAPGRRDTHGCVAMLDNRMMQEIFDLVPLGAKVVIRP